MLRSAVCPSQSGSFPFPFIYILSCTHTAGSSSVPVFPSCSTASGVVGSWQVYDFALHQYFGLKSWTMLPSENEISEMVFFSALMFSPVKILCQHRRNKANRRLFRSILISWWWRCHSHKDLESTFGSGLAWLKSTTVHELRKGKTHNLFLFTQL